MTDTEYDRLLPHVKWMWSYVKYDTKSIANLLDITEARAAYIVARMRDAQYHLKHEIGI